MRSLLVKDLRILRRSRLLVALLILYPVAIALLIGFALSRAPARPRVAVVDETPPGQTVQVGNQRVEVSRYASQLFSQVHAIQERSRAQAVADVNSGKVLAAVVIPPDLASQVASGTNQGLLELIYNGDALQQSVVQSQLSSALAQANLGFSEQIQTAAAQALQVLLKGGNLGVLGAPGNLIGLERIPAELRRVISHQPPGADRAALERVATFADFAAQNLILSKRVLSTVGQPIRVKSVLLRGRRTPLDTFAVVVAVTISLMFISVQLAAGGVAVEREENALARLLRGLVRRETLLSEKSLLAAGCGFVVAFAMLAGVSAFVPLDWSRVALWVAALGFAAVAFGALGVAIGALAREVRASALLGLLLALPLAFLALVPSGSVASGVYAAISAVSFVFPFKAALQALDAAVNGAAPAIGGSLVHLAALTLAFGVIARFGLARVD